MNKVVPRGLDVFGLTYPGNTFFQMIQKRSMLFLAFYPFGRFFKLLYSSLGGFKIVTGKCLLDFEVGIKEIWRKTDRLPLPLL